MNIDLKNLNRDLWSHINTGSIIFYCDPDKVAHFFLTIAEHERETQTGILSTVSDLFDADKCPAKYLPYLAALIGLKLSVEDLEATWRAQIRSAVQWYKEKGKYSAFNYVLYTMGMHADIFPLWIDEEGTVDRYPHDNTWKPHARIDIEIASYTEWRRYLPDKLQYVLSRIEEVRPIHVLIRRFVLIWEFFDIYPFDLISDTSISKVHGNLVDDWGGAYFGWCNIWHYSAPQGTHRNGGNLVWKKSALGVLDTPPTTPVIGDVYLVGAYPTGDWTLHRSQIAAWTGTDWDYAAPVSNEARWVKSSSDESTWIWWKYDGDVWVEGGSFADRSNRPGPFFRNCNGIWNGQIGPKDEFEGTITWYPMPDPYFNCMKHDRVIVRRDGLYMRNCGDVVDTVRCQGTRFKHDGKVARRTMRFKRDGTAYKLCPPFVSARGDVSDTFPTVTRDLLGSPDGGHTSTCKKLVPKHNGLIRYRNQQFVRNGEPTYFIPPKVDYHICGQTEPSSSKLVINLSDNWPGSYSPEDPGVWDDGGIWDDGGTWDSQGAYIDVPALDALEIVQI